MLDGSPTAGTVVPTATFHHQLNEASRLFQQASPYQPPPGVVSQFPQHLAGHALQQHNVSGCQQQNHSAAAAAAAAVAAMSQSSHGGCVLPQLPHGLSAASQSLAAALFASSPLIGDDLKLAAAAAAAAAAAQSRGKKTHRAEPVPQSGFKGVRQKQDQRREARKRGMQNQHCGTPGGIGTAPTGGNLDKLSSDESMMGSPPAIQEQQCQQHAALRCGYPTTPGMSGTTAMMTPGSTTATSQGSNSSEVAYVPIVPIAMDMIEKSGLLQPLELNVLPPCQHCNKQPYPFLMIVSEGQEQTYSGSSIMSLAPHTVTTTQVPPSQASGSGGPPAPNGLSQENSNSRSPDGLANQASNGKLIISVGDIAVGGNGSDALKQLQATSQMLQQVAQDDSNHGSTNEQLPCNSSSEDTRQARTKGSCNTYNRDLLQVKLQDDESDDNRSSMIQSPASPTGWAHHVHSQGLITQNGGPNGTPSTPYGLGGNSSPTLLSMSAPSVMNQQRNLLQHLDPLGAISARGFLHLQAPQSALPNESGSSSASACQGDELLAGEAGPGGLMQGLNPYRLDLASHANGRRVGQEREQSSQISNGIMA